MLADTPGTGDPPHVPGLSSYRVLLIDDDPALRDLIRRILGARRYTIVDAESAEQALSLVRTSVERFDVVVSDVVMTGIDGYELVALLRESVGAMILMSGYPENPDKLPSDVSFVLKPFTPQDLRARIAEVLDSKDTP